MSGRVVPTIAQQSAMSLYLELRFQGTTLSQGTGLVMRSPRGPALITNWHNVAGRDPLTNRVLSETLGIPDEVLIVHNRAGANGQWVARVEPLLNSDGDSLWAEHPRFGRQVDCVALLLTQLDDVQLYPYDCADMRDLSFRIAGLVSVIGFPFGLSAGGALALWATGFVASEPQIDYDNLPQFLIDCRGRPGQSGSAVIAYSSGGGTAMENGDTAFHDGPTYRLLGIYSGRINDQSDLGKVWKIEAIEEIMRSL